MAKSKTEPRIPMLISVLDVKNRPDIPYYIGSMIANTFRKKVLIIDNSESAELFEAIPDSGTGELKKSGNLYFIKSMAYSEQFMERFDCCICYHGSIPTVTLWKKSSHRLILTGYRPSETELAAQPYEDEDFLPLKYVSLTSDCVFFLDHVTDKVKAEKILSDYKLFLQYADKCIPYVEIPMNEQDEICLLSLLYNGSQEAKNAGKDLYSAITGFVAAITQIPLAEFKKMRR